MYDDGGRSSGNEDYSHGEGNGICRYSRMLAVVQDPAWENSKRCRQGTPVSRTILIGIANVLGR